MFAFDQASLPQITTRKAFIGIDFQNDFTASSGALAVTEPDDLVEKTIRLANAFRAVGDVVWVQSRFDKLRPVDPEQNQILASDAILPSSFGRPSSRGRRRTPKPVAPDADATPGPEAFLSHEPPTCVRAGSEGCLMTPAIKEQAMQKTDAVITKTHYSAFEATQLLMLLRAKMVMEVFICGSLTNIGVHATALDAAGHGMAITIVEDCCGYRSDTRQNKAIRNLLEVTGCEVSTCEEVIESISTKPAPQPKAHKAATPSSSKSRESSRKKATDSTPKTSQRKRSKTPDIVKDMGGLRLDSDSPEPAGPQPARTQPQEKASITSRPAAAEKRDSENTPLSKLEEAIEKLEALEVRDDAGDEEDQQVVKNPSKEALSDEKRPTPSSPAPSKPDTNGDSKETPAVAITSPKTPDPPKTTKEQDKMEKRPTAKTTPKQGPPQKGLGAGDTDVIEDLLPASLADGIFDKLREEVQWQRMSHQGGEVPRLVAVQGLLADDGSIPVYRHPSDESPPLLPFSPTVLAIKEHTEKHLGHSLNHVLIQHYRDGNDYISEHSDKTLDIVPGSFIANVSLGAERTMVLRTKRLDKDPSRSEASPPADSKRQIQRARLPHNSLCRMGLKTNMKWLHAIRQDKRMDRDKTPAELAFDGGRISLTFRNIGTFLDSEQKHIWGQGATVKTRAEAKPVINGQTEETITLLKAFGTENHSSDFDWDAHYGKGFDVLHMSNAPRLFASCDSVINTRLAFQLTESRINYARGSMGATATTSPKDGVPVKFIDNDIAQATVEGDVAIMMYLDARHGAGKAPRTATEFAEQFTRFQRGLRLLDKWRALEKDDKGKRDVKKLNSELTIWNGFLTAPENEFLAGSKPTLPDFAVWPVLHAMVEDAGENFLADFDGLKGYYNRVLQMDSVKKVLAK